MRDALEGLIGACRTGRRRHCPIVQSLARGRTPPMDPRRSWPGARREERHAPAAHLRIRGRNPANHPHL